jgi:CheY-like chemotaxis protein
MLLIVDDNKDISDVLSRLLRYAGHKTVSVNSGAQALELLQGSQPELVIMDFHMPVTDGLAVLRNIKESAELRGLPVLMYSSYATDISMNQARNLGASIYPVQATLDFPRFVRYISSFINPPAPVAA